MTAKHQGIKNITIHFSCNYPVISAYEFEYLKVEKEVQALWKRSSIYLIVQRPLIYFDEFYLSDGLINFSISDYTDSKPLQCKFDPGLNGFSAIEEDIYIDLQFYRKPKDYSAPYTDIAGFKLLKLNGDFIYWITPQKFIHHIITGRIKAEIDGDISQYLDYHIHYIGKAFSQDVWNRLTGHEKMQKILAAELPIDDRSQMNSFEISLILLDIEGYNETNLCPVFDFLLDGISDPIYFDVDFEDDGESFNDFYMPKLQANAPELTNEIEAILVNQFEPKYNEILFKNYPNIKNGTRSVGYSKSTLVFESLPAFLSTETYEQPIIIPSS